MAFDGNKRRIDLPVSQSAGPAETKAPAQKSLRRSHAKTSWPQNLVDLGRPHEVGPESLRWAQRPRITTCYGIIATCARYSMLQLLQPFLASKGSNAAGPWVSHRPCRCWNMRVQPGTVERMVALAHVSHGN